MKRFRTLGTLFCIFFVQACNTAPQPRESSALLEFSWVSCDSRELSIFKVQLTDQGSYVFAGSESVNEVGEVRKTVERRTVRRVLEAAEHFVASNLEASFAARDANQKPSGASSTCLRVWLPQSGAIGLARLASEDAIKFNDSQNKFLDFRSRVCPGRKALIAVVGGCERPSILFNLSESRLDCVLTHQVQVTPSGTVRYQLRGTDTVQLDSISPRDVHALETLAKTFIPIGALTNDPGARPMLGSPKQLEEFKRKLTDLTRIEFVREVANQAAVCNFEASSDNWENGIFIFR